MGGTCRFVRGRSSLVHNRLADGLLSGSDGRCGIGVVGDGVYTCDRAATTSQRRTSAGAGENAQGEDRRAAACESDGASGKADKSPGALVSGGARRSGE